jgi:hypothetical protein
MPPSTFCSGYFGDRVLIFAQDDLEPQFYYRLSPCSRDDRFMPPHTAFKLRWGFVKDLPRVASNHDPLNLSLLS